MLTPRCDEDWINFVEDKAVRNAAKLVEINWNIFTDVKGRRSCLTD